MFGSQNNLNDFANHLAKDNFYFNIQLPPRKKALDLSGVFFRIYYICYNIFARGAPPQFFTKRGGSCEQKT